MCELAFSLSQYAEWKAAQQTGASLSVQRLEVGGRGIPLFLFPLSLAQRRAEQNAAQPAMRKSLNQNGGLPHTPPKFEFNILAD